jgi:cystathionine beta-lyase/cystathionine gamma-synthase
MQINNIATLCAHGARDTHNTTGAIALPIYQSATFAHPGVGESTGYSYSRSQNPTREVLEKTIAALEGGTDAMAFSTGMAAMAVLTELFSPGEHIIASGDLYGGSVRLLEHVAKKNGVAVDYLHTGNTYGIKQHIRENTKAIFVETPTNPMMQVTDIAAVAELARAQGLLLIVDNTFLTPYFQRPLALGADVVLHSGTKYLGGHNDTLAGFLVTSSAELSERLRFLSKTIGACLAPFDCFLIQRGVKTLAIRMQRIEENALRIAQWLGTQSRVKAVHYVGLPSHPAYAISCKQASGFGGMISFAVDSAETAKQVLSGVQTIFYAESLGGTESLITYPILQTHADVPEEAREALGINDRLLRLSVGIEAVEDLIADLEAVLK